MFKNLAQVIIDIYRIYHVILNLNDYVIPLFYELHDKFSITDRTKCYRFRVRDTVT